MNIARNIEQRRLGLQNSINNVELHFTLKKVCRLKQGDDDDYADGDVDHRCRSPMASARMTKNSLAVASEDGIIYLFSTDGFEKIKSWSAHENLIFDLKVQPETQKILTAAGDLSIKLWDSEVQQCVTSIHPHSSSTKSVSFYDTNVFCSGSRDGTIKIHDLRLDEPTIFTIKDAHKNETLAKNRFRKKCPRNDPTNCVTSAIFDPYTPRIYSAGANDATLKVWDLRKLHKLKRPHGRASSSIQPVHKIFHPNHGTYCGYSQLLYSNCQLFAGCSDNKVYRYNNIMSLEEPFVFTGFHYKPYYKLATLDNRLLLSSSENGGVTMWNLEKGIKEPVGELGPNNEGSSKEMIAIEADWESLSIFTFRDDFLACKWTI